MNRIAILLVLSLVYSGLQAHGELDKRIKELSIKILDAPQNTSLFLARGELYYQHEDYDLSVEDFKVCEERGYISDRLNLNLAKAYRLLKTYDLSDHYANKVLANYPKHVLALKVKAKTAFDKKEYLRSANLFKEVVAYVDGTHTDNYFEIISALEFCGTKECIQEAIVITESGINDLGELMVFLDKGVSLSLRLKDFNGAHNFQNRIIQNAQRKERKYFQKAILFQEQGMYEEAQEMFESSLAALDKLPNRIKNNRASAKLRAQIVDHLSSIR